ncbi:hypothetical protein [Plantactinospora sp. KLBMP9567]|uniref:hypothetical protein n=1 Tax=Plantactinospora sp. KLBMP9567 TaxID=3085900 RepID=UPI002981F8EE|nr:hypothetical protein [Plantactinospora sp. KLBMP9567]MDW5324856.1 hypothetical protein [Plantactinospora sp. KLBMP9567]
MSGTRPGAGILVPATFLHRGRLPAVRSGWQGGGFTARAVRVTGPVSEQRLCAAVREVHAALPALGVGLFEVDGRPGLRRDGELALRRHDVSGAEPAAREGRCVGLLLADRDRQPDPVREPLARFHVVRLDPGDLVLGLVGHELVLDERALYLVLGAVMEALRGRFRRDAYRDFTELGDFHPLDPAAAESRRRWWSRWFTAYPMPPAPGPAGSERAVRRMVVPADEWRALGDAGGAVRDHGSLGVAALVAWWLRRRAGRPDSAAFSTVLDLREYFDLGPMVGPLTDRIVFRIEEPGTAAPSFRAVLRAAQVGLIRAATHYLPYPELVELGARLGRLRSPRTAALWDAHVHLCRHPSATGRSRGEEPLGIGVEHFGEAELLGVGARPGPDGWDGTNLDLRIGALAGGDMALVLDANRRQPGYSADELLDGLRRAMSTAAADPDAPLETT